MNPFRRIGVIGKRRQPNTQLLQDVCTAIADLGCEVLLESNSALKNARSVEQVSRDVIGQTCELVVVVGGDGTLLDVGRALAPTGVPILGVNQGRLGFMVDIPPATMQETLAVIINGEYEIEDRLLLSARMRRNGGDPGPERLAVNDVVIRNQATIRMIEFETWLGEEFISNHRADGVIVSSPTGSTAYALSGGGPLLHPSLSAMAIIPICPHTLSDRPVVVGGDKLIKIVVHGADRTQAMVTFDGQTSELLKSGDTVEVRSAGCSLRMIHPAGHSYFRILRDKLRWGSDQLPTQERV